MTRTDIDIRLAVERFERAVVTHERAVRELEAARIALSNFEGTVKELERRLEEKSKPA